jgi:hypothetical protein
MRERRIPGRYLAFHLWLTNTNDFLQSADPANPGHKQWERLGLTPAQAAAWDDNTTAWLALWTSYSNKDLKTLSIIRATRDLKKFITDGSRGIVNRIATSAVATEQDATIFNFVLVRKEPTRRTVKIKEQLFAGVQNTGSAEFEVQCRYAKDTKRPSLLGGSDGVECSFKITTDKISDPTSVDPEGEGFQQKTFGKARFVFQAGTANLDKVLLVAFRWNYSPNTDFNGPWTKVQVMRIS